MTNARDMTALELLEAHSKAQQKTIELLRVELASAKECWADALEKVATRNREIERLRGQLNFANREPPHCPSCNCGAIEPSEIRLLFNKGVGVQKGDRFSFSFPTEEEANQAFHYIADLGTLETSQPPVKSNPPQPTGCTHAKMRCERCGEAFSRQDGVQ